MFKLGIQKLYFGGKLYSFVYKMSIILNKMFSFSGIKKKLFQITYWNLKTFMAHAFLVDIIAFARSWEQEQTEENKGIAQPIWIKWLSQGVSPN